MDSADTGGSDLLPETLVGLFDGAGFFVDALFLHPADTYTISEFNDSCTHVHVHTSMIIQKL